MTSSIAQWWHAEADGRVRCDLCHRACLLGEGQAGFCGVRLNQNGALRSLTAGSTSGLSVDPIEKKPLYHVSPGARVLSFGAIGCNLGCRFCQNWEISRTHDLSRLAAATPETIVRLAQTHGCAGVAFTYNEPIVSAEYVVEVAQACREAGLLTVAVTAGYLSGAGREDFFRHMDAANVDLKGFSEAFYRDYCGARLAPVLETLTYLREETATWLEVTTLVIPGANDAPSELDALSAWIVSRLGTDVPLHFSAFHPDYRLHDHPGTPPSTLRRARDLARAAGLRHVYLGNLHDPEGGTTFCPGCGSAVLVREGHRLVRSTLHGETCGVCGARIAGRFVM